MIESYSMLSICCLIQLHFIKFTTYGETVQSVVCLLAFLALVGFPVVLTFRAKRVWGKETLDGFVEQTQPFFEDLELTKGAGVIVVPFYFLVRRLLMAVIIVILGDHLITQVFIMAMSIITAVIINGHVDGLPRKKRIMEFLNETILMFVLYSMICFSPFVPENKARITMGYFCCLVVALHLVVNLSLILAASVQSLIKNFKLWRAKRNLAKQRREKKSAMSAAMLIRREKRKLGILPSTPEEEEVEEFKPVKRKK
jgi:hypothetical protein